MLTGRTPITQGTDVVNPARKKSSGNPELLSVIIDCFYSFRMTAVPCTCFDEPISENGR